MLVSIGFLPIFVVVRHYCSLRPCSGIKCALLLPGMGISPVNLLILEALMDFHPVLSDAILGCLACCLEPSPLKYVHLWVLRPFDGLFACYFQVYGSDKLNKSGHCRVVQR